MLPAWTEPRHHLREIRLAEGKTALGAAQFAMLGDHVALGIPGAVDHDGATFSRAVFRFEPDQPARTAMLANVRRAGEIGAGAAGGGARLGGEALQIATVRRI